MAAKTTAGFRFRSILTVGSFINYLLSSFVDCGVRKSANLRRVLHLFAGYSHLKWGDFRVNRSIRRSRKYSRPCLCWPSISIPRESPLQRNLVQNAKDFVWILASRSLDNRGQQNLSSIQIGYDGACSGTQVFVFLWGGYLA
jgi:hypothetical protein